MECVDIRTLTLVDVATGWTECLPLVARDGGLVVEAIKRAEPVPLAPQEAAKA